MPLIREKILSFRVLALIPSSGEILCQHLQKIRTQHLHMWIKKKHLHMESLACVHSSTQ